MVEIYVYDKTKGYFAGIPARDLTAEEWAELPKEIQKAALKQGLYEIKKEKEVKDA